MQNKNFSETLTWKAPDHTQHRRSSVWYLTFALVALGLFAFAYYTKSITAGITFALIIIVLLIFSAQGGQETTYRITKTGIVAGSTLYPFKIIKKFWIIYNPEVKTLNFETTAYLNNQVVIQLGKQNPVHVKMLLSNYLIEDIDMEESFSDTLARKLKI